LFYYYYYQIFLQLSLFTHYKIYYKMSYFMHTWVQKKLSISTFLFLTKSIFYLMIFILCYTFLNIHLLFSRGSNLMDFRPQNIYKFSSANLSLNEMLLHGNCKTFRLRRLVSNIFYEIAKHLHTIFVSKLFMALYIFSSVYKCLKRNAQETSWQSVKFILFTSKYKSIVQTCAVTFQYR
jgi:hypothetical protein